MKKRFKVKNNKIKTFFLILLFGIIIYTSAFIINKLNIKYIFIENTIKKYDINSNKNKLFNKTEMVFSNLNKIVDYTDYEKNIPLDEIPDIVISEEVVIEEDEERKEVKNEPPLVYIYNTHQTEEYSAPYTADYTITPTVLLASNILSEYLAEYGINSVVEQNSMKEYLTKHKLKYSDSYEASRYYAKRKLEQYPSIEYIIDLHRDSPKLSKTLYEKDGIQYAKIMFVIGQNHDNYKKNMEFVKKLNSLLNKHYKGISRGIYNRKDTRFNQDLKEKAILIELGGYQNTLEQVNNSAKVIAFVLNEYIKENNNAN